MEKYEFLKQTYNESVSSKLGGSSYISFDIVEEFYNYLKNTAMDIYAGDFLYGRDDGVNKVYCEEMRNYRFPQSMFLYDDISFIDVSGNRKLKPEVSTGLRILSFDEGWSCSCGTSCRSINGVNVGSDYLELTLPVRLLESFISERYIMEQGVSTRKIR